MPLIRKDTDKPSQPADGPDARAALDAPAALATGNADARWAAARALAKVPNAAAALGQALAGESDARVREAIFTSLAHLKSAAAAAAVIPYLRSQDAAMRTGALDALTVMPDAAANFLPALLSDPDPDIRLLSCDIARRLAPSLATKLLCDVLERDDAANVCAAAVDVLSEVGEPAALPVLAKCAERFADNSFLVFAIDVARKRIGAGAS